MKPLGMVVLLITLSACASPQKLTQTQCVVEHISGFVDTTGNLARITVAENASPCVIHLSRDTRKTRQFGLGERVGLGRQLATQPAHGTAYMQDIADVT